MDELRKVFGGKCILAGYSDRGPCDGPLEFAHVKPTGLCSRGRGRANRYHDIKRNPDCYALLCRRHHRRVDAERWVMGTATQ